MDTTYSRDEVIRLMSDCANVAVAAWLDPGQHCKREKEEGLGDWCSRAKAIAVNNYIKLSLAKNSPRKKEGFATANTPTKHQWSSTDRSSRW